MFSGKVKHNRITLVVAVLVIMLTVPGFAASTNWIDRIPAVRVDQEITGDLAPRLSIEEYAVGEFSGEPQTIRLVLTGAEWLEEDHPFGPNQIETDTVVTGAANGIQTQRLSSTMLNVTLTSSTSSEKGLWRIPLYTKALEAGDISVRIDAMDSRVSGTINNYADGVNGGTEMPVDPEEPTEPEPPEEPEEPAEPEEPEMPAATEVTFTIGQTGYWVAGQWIVSDIAPYIQATTDGLGRIMVPVRFVAEATGASDMTWDPVGRNVIVLKGDTQLQMTIGSTQLLVNGEVREMDAVAEIQDLGGGLGRTMVPLAHLARALNVSYEWNPETRSVTFSVVE